jgi:hypothetical protein
MNKVWTYVISKELDENSRKALQQAGEDFVQHWTAHENKLKADFEIYGQRIVIVKVNEDVHGASGCSIDKLQRFIKETEKKFGIELLNRMLVALKKDGELFVTHSSKISELLKAGSINENTPVLNTAASDENELNSWEKPLKDTWLNRYVAKA